MQLADWYVTIFGQHLETSSLPYSAGFHNWERIMEARIQ